MPLDEGTLARGCGGSLRTADHLCRRQVDLARRLIGSGAPVTIGCTQEAPLFTEIAEELGAADRVVFANIRENAGWSDDAQRAGPKMAALLAAAVLALSDEALAGRLDAYRARQSGGIAERPDRNEA